MIINLIDYTQDAEYKIGLAASKCYDGKIDISSCIKRAAHCVSSGHLSTMRFAYATFEILGISRVTSHQLVRVAHAGILQESQRYVAQTNVKYVIPPSVLQHSELLPEWTEYLEQGNSLYAKAIETGVKKEDARYILPQSAYTSLTICMNFQGWKDFIALRSTKASQWEIREVASTIKEMLNGIAPNLFPLESITK